MTLSKEQETSIGPTVAAALSEDIGSGDLTAALIDADTIVGATIVAREFMVIAGEHWVNEVFAQVDSNVLVDWYIGDRQTAESNDVVCKLVGPARSLLTGERTALNFLQTLSGTATVTAQYVQAVADTKCRILDTRKTIPGLRLAQKYAVACGGGHNHRIGLHDAILIKENHIRSSGGIAATLAAAEAANSDVVIEIEVESISELNEALNAGATRILLDNFSLQDLKAAVEINSSMGYLAAELEASGNITLDTIGEIAATGVDYISTGAITKHVRAADLSMLLRID